MNNYIRLLFFRLVFDQNRLIHDKTECPKPLKFCFSPSRPIGLCTYRLVFRAYAHAATQHTVGRGNTIFLTMMGIYSCILFFRLVFYQNKLFHHRTECSKPLTLYFSPSRPTGLCTHRRPFSRTSPYTYLIYGGWIDFNFFSN